MNSYGVRFMGTFPHISLGISAHVWPPKFAHLSLHLPIGVVIIGCTGQARQYQPAFPTEHERKHLDDN